MVRLGPSEVDKDRSRGRQRLQSRRRQKPQSQRSLSHRRINLLLLESPSVHISFDNDDYRIRLRRKVSCTLKGPMGLMTPLMDPHGAQ